MTGWCKPLGLLLVLAIAGCGGGADGPSSAQTVASPTLTDIWVAELLDSHRGLRVGTPHNVTDRQGYDNQPHFLPDGSGFLYTAIDDTGQADTWRYEFDRGRRFRVTRTPEGEYSPTPHPDGGFTVIRVELDDTQRLWRFDDDGRNPQRLLDEVQPVGYQAWFNAHQVGLFILGEPPQLTIANLADGSATVALQSIGRSLQAVPGKATISAVHKASEDEWNIVEVTVAGEVTTIAPLPRPAEDFTWLPDGQLLAGRGAKLYVFRPGNANGWQEIADLAEHGVVQITRIAVSPTGDRIAFVAQR